MRKRGLCCGPVSVRLSLRPSVTLVSCIQTAEYIVRLLSRPKCATILVFFYPGADTQFQEVPLLRGAKYKGW